MDAEEELGEARELCARAGAELVGEMTQRRRAPDPRTYLGKGRFNELGPRMAESAAESLDRRRRSRSEPAATPRGRPQASRRRPDAADPRHLCAARKDGRGQAPGRARAARVQPAADARLVAAPGAPRRRHRHAGPGRVAARDRPAPRPAPDRAREGEAALARAPARDPAGRQTARRDSSGRARRLYERRQVDAAERAHGCRRVGERPPVRDAGPDDAHVRARRQDAIS